MLGEESRIVIEMGDEDINVFNIFQLLNRSPTPVQPAEPLVFDLPARARGAGLLDGSTPLGKLEGKVVTVSGPFPPGSTLLQFAYSIPFGSGTVVIDQKLPAALDHVAVVVQKVGPMRLESPQVAEQREMPAQGQTYIAARGRGLKAGETLSLTVSGLPHSPTWPRNVALALAVVVLAAGVWASARPARASTATDSRRKQLTATRERLFRELTAIEDQHRDGTIDPERYATRRREMIAGLERIYAQLDEDAAA
jgi:hypothetical protein